MARNPAKAAKPRAAKAAKPKPAPAKKAGAKKAAKAGTKPVPKSEIDAAAARGAAASVKATKLPSAEFLTKLVKTTLPGFEAEMTSTRGDMGSAVANAVENHHVEKRALAIARRLHKLADKKFSETWEHLQHYFDVLGFQKRYDDMPKLALSNGEPSDGAEETETNTADRDAPTMKIVDAPLPGDDAEPTALADAMHEAIQRDEAAKATLN